jgi:hypothetical protein
MTTTRAIKSGRLAILSPQDAGLTMLPPLADLIALRASLAENSHSVAAVGRFDRIARFSPSASISLRLTFARTPTFTAGSPPNCSGAQVWADYKGLAQTARVALLRMVKRATMACVSTLTRAIKDRMIIRNEQGLFQS